MMMNRPKKLYPNRMIGRLIPSFIIAPFLLENGSMMLSYAKMLFHNNTLNPGTLYRNDN